MPTTASGIVYPASTDHTRIWEHMEDTADSIEPLIADRLPFRTAHVTDTPGANAISTAEAVEATVSVTVPASWNSYNLRCTAHFRLVEVGVVTAPRTVGLNLRKNNISGTAGMQTSAGVSGDPPHNNMPVSIGARWDGETATGSVSVVLTMSITGDNDQMGWDNLFMEIWAFRTS